MRLSDDYLSVASEVYLFDQLIESPAMLKRNGMYYIFGSHLTGWDPNDNVYSTATSISGPWSARREFADNGANTYHSQSTFILTVGNTAMYMGDRWHSGNLARSTYVWLPLEISGTSVWMQNRVNWRFTDLNTGAWSSGPSENWYEGESATLSGGARSVSCSGCSGSAAGYIGGSSGGAVQFSNVRSDATTKTTIRVNYKNGDSSERFVDVSVNGGAAQRVAFVQTGSSAGSSTLHANLNSGTNTIRISGVNGGWGPDIDRLMVPAT
jgi:hypothetical protein